MLDEVTEYATINDFPDSYAWYEYDDGQSVQAFMLSLEFPRSIDILATEGATAFTITLKGKSFAITTIMNAVRADALDRKVFYGAKLERHDLLTLRLRFNDKEHLEPGVPTNAVKLQGRGQLDGVSSVTCGDEMTGGQLSLPSSTATSQLLPIAPSPPAPLPLQPPVSSGAQGPLAAGSTLTTGPVDGMTYGLVVFMITLTGLIGVRARRLLGGDDRGPRRGRGGGGLAGAVAKASAADDNRHATATPSEVAWRESRVRHLQICRTRTMIKGAWGAIWKVSP